MATTAEITEGEGSMAKTPEEILAEDASAVGEVEEVRDLSAEEIADAEEADSESMRFRMRTLVKRRSS